MYTYICAEAFFLGGGGGVGGAFIYICPPPAAGVPQRHCELCIEIMSFIDAIIPVHKGNVF